MTPLFIDFETYYDADYSLKKLSTIEYVRSPDFKVHCVGIVVGAHRLTYTGEEFTEVVNKIPWKQYRVVAHNAQFDAFILSEHYGVNPGEWACTLQMARCVLGRRANQYGLDYLAKLLKLGKKVAGVLPNMAGKRNLTPEEMQKLQEYCLIDTDLCAALYHKLIGLGIPDSELRLLDQTIRCMTEPVLELDLPLLRSYHNRLEQERQEALDRCGHDLKTLRSRPKFAKALEDLGVNPPTKISPRTGKETYAFAKDDEGFLELLDHPDERVRWLTQAKLMANGSNAITRADRLLRIGNPLPIPLLFWGAHTGRWSGTGSKINLQNLNRGSELRNAIMAPDGCVVVCGDLSQVELRINAALCNERLLLEELHAGEDVYCTFASRVYGRPITKVDELERFLGKTCQLGLGFGTAEKKLRHTLYIRSDGEVDISLERTKEIVDLWRATYAAIPAMWWDTLPKAINVMAGVEKGPMRVGPLVFTRGRVRLPNGAFIYYPKLRQVYNEENDRWEWVYGVGKSRYRLYGAKLLENVVQALARVQMSSAWLKLVDAGYKVRLTVHDELVVVAPEDEAEHVKALMHQYLVAVPDWLPNVPLEAEVSYAKRWGEAK